MGGAPPPRGPDEVDEWYDGTTAPYLVEHWEAACRRSAAAMANAVRRGTRNSGERPNAVLVPEDPEEPGTSPVWLVADADIHDGEEILLDYGAEYVMDVDQATHRYRRPDVPQNRREGFRSHRWLLRGGWKRTRPPPARAATGTSTPRLPP